MKRTTKLLLNRETVRQLAEHDLRRAAAGARNDSLDEASCNPCGDWPTSPYRGCTL